jgi:hypothetical protein
MSLLKNVLISMFCSIIFIRCQISKSEHATSGVFLAYQNEITSMPQGVSNSFTKTYGVTFLTVPIVIAGLQDYKMFDFFYY